MILEVVGDNMLKSVNVYFNPKIDTKDKLNKIKELGYNECFTGLDRYAENISLKKEIKYIKKLGFNITMIHCKYDGKILDNFWLDNKIGDYIVKDYSKQMKKIKGFTKNFVIHLNGSRNSTTSEIGIERIKKLLEVAKKCDLNLCIENLFSSFEIPYIFDHINDEHLKICFDVGHKNCLTPNFDLIKDYGKYISVLHIHDNNSKNDEHKILGTGTINLKELAKDLSMYTNLVLSAEVKQKDDNDYIEYLKENYIALTNLENDISNLINKF